MAHLQDSRIVNIRMTVCGLNIDAAVDCDWQLHCYDTPLDERTNIVPVELYCFDKPDWDIEMVYLKEKNDPHKPHSYGLDILHTVVDLDTIKKEARKWVRAMVKNEKK